MAQALGGSILASWRKLNSTAAGRWLFSRMIRFSVPYSASVGAVIEVLEPGHARLVLQDRKAVRNHLNCVHALALANAAELCSGIAMLAGLGDERRGIVTKLETEYLKKARGRLVVESKPDIPPPSSEPVTHLVHADIFDQSGDKVARFTAHWLISQAPQKAAA